MIADERLTEHFFLSEFTRSDTAARLGIANTPEPWVIVNLRHNAEHMELIRLLLGVPILISSGYRSEELEQVICERDYFAWCRRNKIMPGGSAWKTYFQRKQHPLGLATDFTAPAYGSPAYVCRRIAESDIAFQQLIYEHSWCHVSWPPSWKDAKREVLTLTADGGYENGIVETA